MGGFVIEGRALHRALEFFAADSFNPGAEAGKFLLNAFITPVEVVHTKDFRLAFGRKSGQNE